MTPFKFEPAGPMGEYRVLWRKPGNGLVFVGTVLKWERRYNLRRVIVSRGWRARTPEGDRMYHSDGTTADTRRDAAEQLRVAFETKAVEADRARLVEAGFERELHSRFDLWKHPKTGQRMSTAMAVSMLDGKRCYAVLHHGPGHQSTTNCEQVGLHDVHHAEVHGEVARWQGDTASSGFFDQMPEVTA